MTMINRECDLCGHGDCHLIDGLCSACHAQFGDVREHGLGDESDVTHLMDQIPDLAAGYREMFGIETVRAKAA